MTTSLTWDATSSLTESNGQGGNVFCAYDASGQRVLQARIADAGGAGGTATAYTPAGQLDDPDTASTSEGDVTGTRYYAFAGATVAVRTVTDTEAGRVVSLAFLFGDEQGSTSVMMPAHVDASGAVAPATLADASAATRTAYTPYGALRGGDNAALDRGWLGQVEDRVVGATGTGLTYLNARYYDPATMRFISPDPLMNPADPKTLDPYRYADNNPVVFTDASGLSPVVPKPFCGNLKGYAYSACWGVARRAIDLEAKYAAGWADWEGQQNYQKSFSKNSWFRGVQRAVDGMIVTPVTSFVADPTTTAKTMFTQNVKNMAYGPLWMVYQMGKGAYSGGSAAYQEGGFLELVGYIQTASAITYVSVRGPTMAYEGVGAALPKPAVVAPASPNAGPVGVGIKPGAMGGPTAGKPFTQAVRSQALAENPSTCVYCRMETSTPQVDHAQPRVAGGSATIENAQTTCPWCNASKGSRQFPVNPPPGYEGPWPPPWWENEP